MSVATCQSQLCAAVIAVAALALQGCEHHLSVPVKLYCKNEVRLVVEEQEEKALKQLTHACKKAGKVKAQNSCMEAGIGSFDTTCDEGINHWLSKCIDVSMKDDRLRRGQSHGSGGFFDVSVEEVVITFMKSNRADIVGDCQKRFAAVVKKASASTGAESKWLLPSRAALLAAAGHPLDFAGTALAAVAAAAVVGTAAMLAFRARSREARGTGGADAGARLPFHGPCD